MSTIWAEVIESLGTVGGTRLDDDSIGIEVLGLDKQSRLTSIVTRKELGPDFELIKIIALILPTTLVNASNAFAEFGDLQVGSLALMEIEESGQWLVVQGLLPLHTFRPDEPIMVKLYAQILTNAAERIRSRFYDGTSEIR